VLGRATSPRFFLVLFSAGLLLRLAVLPLAGTDDFDVWKLWTHAASTDLTRMYGVGGHPPERALVVWGTRRATVDYPPAALYGLSAVGHAYRTYDPAFGDNRHLTVALKLSILAGDLGLCAALWRLLRRASPAAARAGVLFYWLNPAAILDGAVLGYLDPWIGATTVASVLAIDAGAFALAGVLVAVTALIKLQILLVLPAVALALVVRAGRQWPPAALAAAAGAALTVVLLVFPFAAAGALPNLILGAGRAFHHDMLSAEAVNVWWIFTWMLRGYEAPVRILGISRAIAIGYPSPRLIGTILGGVTMLWAFWRSRTGPLPIVLAGGALAMHCYTVLSVQVHENHLYLALPLMAAAGAVLPRMRAPYALVSLVCFLNLFLFQGLGKDVPLPPRVIGGLDVTVVVAFVNVAALAWHAWRFARLTSGGSSDRCDPASPGESGRTDPARTYRPAPRPDARPTTECAGTRPRAA
jgi:hypothetical protein